MTSTDHRDEPAPVEARRRPDHGDIRDVTTPSFTLVPPNASTVVELGAGTGAISAVLARRLPAGCRLVAVESDRVMVPHLRVAAPTADVLWGSAGDLPALPGAPEAGTVDVVLSALPWSRFTPAVQEHLLNVITTVLTDDGVFSTIVYCPTRLRAGFRTRLAAHFGDVTVSDVVWCNLPPARLLTARRPRSRPPVDPGPVRAGERR